VVRESRSLDHFNLNQLLVKRHQERKRGGDLSDYFSRSNRPITASQETVTSRTLLPAADRDCALALQEFGKLVALK
jgi:hypothetical protein